MSFTHTLLLARLAIVREDLHDVLGRITEESFAWAPREGMRTIGGQLKEIAGTEVQLRTLYGEGRELSFQESEDFGPLSESLAGMKEVLEAERRKTIAWIEGMDEAQLLAMTSVPEGWWEGVGLPEVPLAEVVRSLAAHEWYHVGQLVSYVWAMGDDPYQWS